MIFLHENQFNSLKPFETGLFWEKIQRTNFLTFRKWFSFLEFVHIWTSESFPNMIFFEAVEMTKRNITIWAIKACANWLQTTGWWSSSRFWPLWAIFFKEIMTSCSIKKRREMGKDTYKLEEGITYDFHEAGNHNTSVWRKQSHNIYFGEMQRNSNSHTADHVKFPMTFWNITRPEMAKEKSRR